VVLVVVGVVIWVLAPVSGSGVWCIGWRESQPEVSAVPDSDESGRKPDGVFPYSEIPLLDDPESVPSSVSTILHEYGVTKLERREFVASLIPLRLLSGLGDRLI
jgi:hypothetical protein